MSNTEQNKNYISAFFSKPIVGILGSIFSIIALPLSVYFYCESIKSPDLTFSRNPTKLEIIAASKSSKLSVDYNGQPIRGDVSVAQIAIWNQGNKPIKTEDILAPIVIQANPPVAVLETNVRKVSRDVSQFEIKANQPDKNQISVTWKILEQGDGGIIEIIYVGAPDTIFDVNGTIIGQKDIVRYNNKIGFESPDEEFEFSRNMNKWKQFYFLPLSVLTFIGAIFTFIKSVKRKKSHSLLDSRIPFIILTILLLMISVLSVSIFILSKYPIPPSGI